jgi:hypothetical protein
MRIYIVPLIVFSIFSILTIIVGLNLNDYTYNGFSKVSEDQLVAISTENLNNLESIEIIETNKTYSIYYNFRSSTYYPFLISNKNTWEQVILTSIMGIATLGFTAVAYILARKIDSYKEIDNGDKQLCKS